ncbi:hypothetical protein A9Q99_14690 [Gammaproteobacteria bacterium 45_16_T64]|nr:hypothetical protein A9Q99_14690 [Gammaproteobacteria bacterium 45_16_T64]
MDINTASDGVVALSGPDSGVTTLDQTSDQRGVNRDERIPNPAITRQQDANTSAASAGNTGGAPVLQAPIHFPSGHSNEALLFEILLAKTESAQQKIQNSEVTVKVNSQLSADQTQFLSEKMDELRDKMAEQEKAGKLSRIFGWVATIASFIVAAVLTLTVVGAPAGAALMAGATIGLVNQISMETGGWFAKGVAELFASSDMTQEEKEEAANWLITGVSIALSLGGAAAGAGAKGAQMIAKMAQNVKDVGARLATELPKTALKLLDDVAEILMSAGSQIRNAPVVKQAIDIIVYVLKGMANGGAYVGSKLSSNSASIAEKVGLKTMQNADDFERVANKVISLGMVTTGVGGVGKGSSEITVGKITEEAGNIQADTVEIDSLITWYGDKVREGIEDYNTAINDMNRGFSLVRSMFEGSFESNAAAMRI